MINIEAAKRLKLHATLSMTREEAEVEETAAFDETRSEELRTYIAPLAKVGLRFTFKDDCLKCTVENEDAVDSAKKCAVVLNKLGCRLSIRPKVFEKPTFALRGANGVILQRITPTMLRIFFTK